MSLMKNKKITYKTRQDNESESMPDEKELVFLTREETIYERNLDGDICPVEGVVEVYDRGLDTEIREETMALAALINKEKAISKTMSSPEQKDITPLKKAYESALISGDKKEIALAESELKSAIVYNDRQQMTHRQEKNKLGEVKATIEQSRDLIEVMKAELKKNKQYFKIKYIPCKIGEAVNIQKGIYFDGRDYDHESKSESGDTLVPNEYLILKKCVSPKYTEHDIKAMKPDYLMAIVQCINAGSGLYNMSYRQILLDGISTKKKKTTDDTSQD